MATPLVSRARVTRATDDQPLTRPAIQRAAPAVFSEGPADHLSNRYAYIPTSIVLNRLMKAGFTVQEVAQARPQKRTQDREPYAKHMLRLRFPKVPKVGDAVPELVMLNAHDGTACYDLFAGIYRFICCNGIVVGSTFMGIKIRHTGGEETSSRVLEKSLEIVEGRFPKLLLSIATMRRRILRPREQQAFAARAIALRYPDGNSPIGPEAMLQVRRPEDEAGDLWTVFNRIQENALQGGMETKSFMYNRRSHVRPIQRIEQNLRINQGLWDVAAGYLPENA